MKKFLSILLVIAICLCFASCGKKNGSGNNTVDGVDGGEGGWKIPEKILTTEEYHAELDKLLKTQNFSNAEDGFLDKLDTLSAQLKDMIVYNMDDLTECSGTKYYVSNSGDDSNDGKSPETAWATLKKVNAFSFKEGDLVLFERGGLWRGYLSVKSNVSYSAYGNGPKPKIWTSYDGLTHGNWNATDTPNVWVLDKKIAQTDLGLIVFNGGENYGDLKRKKSALKENFDYFFGNSLREDDSRQDFLVYLYYDGGNPAEVFDAIDLCMDTKIITNTARGLTNVHLNNLELRYGRGPFWAGWSKDLKMSYCVCEWSGGFADSAQPRMGGGSGCYGSCDGFEYDFCYFNQQFDSGVSPQYDYEDKDPVIHKDFITTNCLFENVEYTLEYFNTQDNTLLNRYENMQFKYNICRSGGYGFGTKASVSAYIKSWGHENSCYNCEITNNVFDRAAALTLEIVGYEQKESGNELSYERIPKLENNIYIQKSGKKFANINKTIYKFEQQTCTTLESLGVDRGSIYLFSK